MDILKWYAEKAQMLPEGAFERNLIFLGLLVLLVIFVIWLTRRMARRRLTLAASREHEVQLKAELDEQTQLSRGHELKADELTARLQQAQAETPEARLALAEHARNEHRYEHAVPHLVSLFNDLSPIIATCSQQLAEFALSLWTGERDSRHVRAAARLSQIAALCARTEPSPAKLALDAEIDRRVTAAGRLSSSNDSAETLNEVAAAYLGSEDANGARTLIDSLAERAVRLHRDGFPHTASLLLERARSVADVRLDPKDPRRMRSLAVLASAFSRLGRFHDEEAALRHLLEQEEVTLGPSHAETVRTRQTLVFALGRQGRHDEAESILRGLLADQEHALGLTHPDTLATQNNLAGALFRQDRFAEAEELFRDVWRSREETLGPNHPDTQRAVGNLAQTLAAAGRHEDARALWIELLAEQERIYGADHPATLRTRLQMADGLAQAGRRTEAAAIIKGILAKLTRFLGAAHPETIAAAEALARLGDLAAASPGAEANTAAGAPAPHPIAGLAAGIVPGSGLTPAGARAGNP